MFNMSLAFEMKTLFACERGLFHKVMTHKLCQNANFGNGGYHYSNWHPSCTVEHVVNIITV